MSEFKRFMLRVSQNLSVVVFTIIVFSAFCLGLDLFDKNKIGTVVFFGIPMAAFITISFIFMVAFIVCVIIDKKERD